MLGPLFPAILALSPAHSVLWDALLTLVCLAYGSPFPAPGRVPSLCALLAFYTYLYHYVEIILFFNEPGTQYVLCKYWLESVLIQRFSTLIHVGLKQAGTVSWRILAHAQCPVLGQRGEGWLWAGKHARCFLTLSATIFPAIGLAVFIIPTYEDQSHTAFWFVSKPLPLTRTGCFLKAGAWS